jgi:hypothetical protein
MPSASIPPYLIKRRIKLQTPLPSGGGKEKKEMINKIKTASGEEELICNHCFVIARLQDEFFVKIGHELVGTCARCGESISTAIPSTLVNNKHYI